MYLELIQLGIIGGSELYRWYTHRNDKVEPRYETFTGPTSEAGSALPVVFGRFRVNSPALILADSYSRNEVNGHPGSFMHSMRLGFVSGIPMEDANGMLHAIWIGDKKIDCVLTGDNSGQRQINEGTLFGGPGNGGGVIGTAWFRDGRASQNLPMELNLLIQGLDDTLFPSYRGQMTVWFGPSWELGESTSVDPYSFEVSTFGSFKAGFATALTGLDADPVNVIYELLTGKFGKLNIPAAQIDLASFAAASVTLAAEGHGYSMAHYGNESARAIIQNITAQINGVLYIDSVTGLIRLKLIRNDYTFGSIPVFDETNVVRIDSYVIPSWQSVLNQVRVQFSNRAQDYKEDVAVAQNQANAVGQNGVSRSTTLRYPGVTDPYLAGKIAQRELAVVGTPVSRIKFTCNRDGYTLRPGDAIRINMPTGYQLNDQVFRVAGVDLGQLFDNKVTVEAVLDVFNLGGEGQIAPPDEVTYEPTAPGPLTQRLLTEAPRWMLAKAFAAGYVNSPDVQRIMAAAKSDGIAYSYAEQTFSLFSFAPAIDVPWSLFNGAGKVQAIYARDKDPYDTVTGLYLYGLDARGIVAATRTATAESIRSNGANLIQVGDEIMAYESGTNMGSGVYRLNNVWRGLLDTAAVAHAVDEPVFFLNWSTRLGRIGWSRDQGTSGTSIELNSSNETGSGEEVADPITFRERAALPYPPADLKATNTAYLATPKNVTNFDEGLNLTATIRNRSSLRIQRGDDAAETVESGASYTFTAQKGTGPEATLYTAASIPEATSLTLGGAGHGALKVYAKASRTIPFITGSVAENAWRSPAIDVQAPVYRNLLGNPRFADASIAPWVSSGAAAAAVVTGGAEQLGANTSNSYITSSSTSLDFQADQEVDIAGYKASRMGAVLDFYVRGALSAKSGSSQYEVIATALDSVGGSLGSVTTGTLTATSAYAHGTLDYSPLPDGTSRVKFSILGQANVAVTETSLRVGQFSAQLLANAGLDSALTSWTNTGGAFAIVTTTKYIGAGYARGGSSTGEIYQTIAIPAGFLAGATATLSLARMNDAATDTGSAVIEILNAGASVVATVSTADEAISPLSQWVRRKIAVAIPVGGVNIKVRLLAKLNTAAPANTCFDDLDLRVHKELDPSYSKEFTWDAPVTQQLPQTWQQHKLAYPNIARPFAVFDGSEPSSRNMEIAWSDNVARAASNFVGPFAKEKTLDTCFTFTRQSGPGALELTARGTYAATYGNFRKSRSFTVWGLFRLDEKTFGGACGIVGRNDGATGWGIGINASGQLTASLYGVLGTKTVTRTGSTVIDGALHMFAMAYDATANTMTLYDERGNVSVSTAATMGEFYNATPGVQFRIGRAATSENTLPGQLGRLVMFNSALSTVEINSLFNIGKSAVTMTYSKAFVGYADGLPNTGGDSIMMTATDQVAYGYNSQLTTDGGTGWGLAMARAYTNVIPSFDFANTSFWNKNGSATLTQGVQDPTGLYRGVTVTGAPGNGIFAQAVAVTATANIALAFWAKASTLQNVDVALFNSSSVLKQTVTVAMTAGWKKYVVQFTAWDGSTANCLIRLSNATGSSSAFSLGHVVWASQVNGDIPAVLGGPGASAAVTVSMAESPPALFNFDGEIIADGVFASNSIGQCTIASIKGGANANRRDLNADTSPKHAHYDSAGAAVTSVASTLNWGQRWQLRGRWNQAKTLDNVATPYAGIIADGSVDSTVFTRTSSWTANSTLCTTLSLGTGTFTGGINALVRRVKLTAREEIL